MNKKDLSERDICTKFITPALTAGNKRDLMSQIREEVSFTKGRVIVRGQLSTRGEAKQVLRNLSRALPGRVRNAIPAPTPRRTTADCGEGGGVAGVVRRTGGAADRRARTPTRLVRSALDHLTTSSRSSRRESALTETKPGKSLSGLTSAATRMAELLRWCDAAGGPAHCRPNHRHPPPRRHPPRNPQPSAPASLCDG